MGFFPSLSSIFSIQIFLIRKLPHARCTIHLQQVYYFYVIYQTLSFQVCITNISPHHSVSAIAPSEVTWFNLEWKIPCVLFYSSDSTKVSGAGDAGQAPAPANNGSALNQTKNLFGEVGSAESPAAFTPLASHEMPKKGIFLSIAKVSYQ